MLERCPILIPLTGKTFDLPGRKPSPFIEQGLETYSLLDLPELRHGIDPGVQMNAVRLDADGAHAVFDIRGFPFAEFWASVDQTKGRFTEELKCTINRVRGTMVTDKGEGFAVKAAFTMTGTIELKSGLTNVQIELTSLRHEDGEDFFIPVSDFRKSYALCVHPLHNQHIYD